jgi:inner membrane protein
VSAPGIWLATALALGVAELLVPGVFLVFFAAAAAITGAMSLAIPDLGPAGQLGAFAIWSIVAVAVGRRWYRDYPVAGDPQLNDRTARLVGQVVLVEEPLTHGAGRVRVGDGAWPARGPDVPAGTPMRVVAVDGGVLTVEPVEPGASLP